jgi:hypothetical protein
MLSLDECIGMSGLTDDEIAVIAEHEHVPIIVAAGLGHHLLKSPKGIFQLRGFISELLGQAKLAGNGERVKHLDGVLRRFNCVHPVPTVLTPPRVRRIPRFGLRKKRRSVQVQGT